VEVVSVLLSGGAALETQDQVSAVVDDEMSDKSESELSLSITGHLCILLAQKAMWR
jgi:hypothetical protein